MSNEGKTEFRKVLAANRGEIAIRIFRACHDLGINTMAMYSKEDIDSLFRVNADEAYLIGEHGSPLGAYLGIDDIIRLAKSRHVDAIHPGYGFLSENADFAKACKEAGIEFIGPTEDILRMMGDKLAAKRIAHECNVKTVPGSKKPLKDADEALELAKSFGFPIIFKAAAGGGGRGMRKCVSEDEVRTTFEMVQSEALNAFGSGDIFIEKYVEHPKHIEVQILGDKYGNVVHLGERDCSLQRRFQKVVEFSPAFSIPDEVRQALYEDAVKISKHVGYVSAGTVEFLVDTSSWDHYFIEMNPRIQVEHTVSEMVTGIDIVRAQVLIAEGHKLSDPLIGINSQEDVHLHGYALQCRVTTEDPANNFAPNTGRISSFNYPGGFGIRVDSGCSTSGAEISPYYDSLLMKITAHDVTFQGACSKALRALSEVHVRGVKTNIPFVTNVLSHPVFQSGGCWTKFIDETPELFEIEESRDRATRVLKYIANIQVANPDAERSQYAIPRFPPVTGNRKDGLKQLLDSQGPKAVADWVLAQKKVLITDTTMRDAHQSLLSTRMRTRDMVKGAEGTSEILADCFSLEMWGGATFDTAFRFLYENPWERLRLLREKIPNILFQMLLRGANAVGYMNYPDNVIRKFIDLSADAGIDVFRIFDSLNWIPGMEVAMDEVLKKDKICEAAICYTGEILDPKNDKFTLNYYVNMAKELEKRGAHFLAIKDMAGLLKPYSAAKLVSTLKQEIGIPIQLHTHDTTSNQIATLLMATEAGVDIVDTAISSMSHLTSQPSMNAFVAALQGQERDTGFDLDQLQYLTDYYEDVRLRYKNFDHGLKAPVTDIYKYEIPGGQYTNLYPQVESIGLAHRFQEVKEMYKKVDLMLGGIVKVTPSSKMVGDLAIFMVQNNLTPENIVEKGATLSFPDSVVSYFKGMMGQPSWGFPEDLQKIVLKGEKPITCRPGELLPPADFDEARQALEKYISDPSEEMIISWLLYPKVVENYCKHRKEYGYIMRMGSHVFFNGLAMGETNQINIEDGKTLVIKYLGLGDRNDNGTRNVIFTLNGARRVVAVDDPFASSDSKKVVMADPDNHEEIGAPIPGMVSKIIVKKGDKVKVNDPVAIVEAMKMETSLVSSINGTVEEILVKAGATVQSGELIMKLKED
ncbi:MAG: pyruvate carboxylase [Lachnospiraceae bacterium]|nr:pyruvate carboxylase [Lachnospiraceae bacterium]